MQGEPIVKSVLPAFLLHKHILNDVLEMYSIKFEVVTKLYKPLDLPLARAYVTKGTPFPGIYVLHTNSVAYVGFAVYLALTLVK